MLLEKVGALLNVHGLLKSIVLKSRITVDFIKTLPGRQLVPDTSPARSGYFLDPVESAVVSPKQMLKNFLYHSCAHFYYRHSVYSL